MEGAVKPWEWVPHLKMGPRDWMEYICLIRSVESEPVVKRHLKKLAEAASK